MHYIKNYNLLFKKDFLLKFYNKKLIYTGLPQLKKIILNFQYTNTDLKLIVSTLILLEIITNKTPKIMRRKKVNLSIKIKKGQPIGCQVILTKSKINYFLNTLVSSGSLTQSNISFFNVNKNFLSFSLSNVGIFKVNFLTNNYHLYNKIPKLNILLLFTTKQKKELYFLLKYYKFILH